MDAKKFGVKAVFGDPVIFGPEGYKKNMAWQSSQAVEHKLAELEAAYLRGGMEAVRRDVR